MLCLYLYIIIVSYFYNNFNENAETQTFSVKMQIFSKKSRKQTTGLVIRRPAVRLPPYPKDNTGILLSCFDFSYRRQNQTSPFQEIAA